MASLQMLEKAPYAFYLTGISTRVKNKNDPWNYSGISLLEEHSGLYSQWETVHGTNSSVGDYNPRQEDNFLFEPCPMLVLIVRRLEYVFDRSRDVCEVQTLAMHLKTGSKT
jgi:hypothetical protein